MLYGKIQYSSPQQVSGISDLRNRNVLFQCVVCFAFIACLVFILMTAGWHTPRFFGQVKKLFFVTYL